jgi:hypothetical protein
MLLRKNIIYMGALSALFKMLGIRKAAGVIVV